MTKYELITKIKHITYCITIMAFASLCRGFWIGRFELMIADAFIMLCCQLIRDLMKYYLKMEL